MDKNVLVTAAQRLLEYVKNPHHINPMSAAFTALVEEASSLLAQTAEQHQGDPVAWLNTATGNVTTSSVVVMDWDDEKEHVQSLYTHADAGEVERLRIELAEQREIFGMQEDKIDTLRAKLAERDELLSDIAEEWGSGGQGSEQLWGRIRTYLSASAEPSAPIVHPINMKTLMQAYEQVDHKALLHGTSNWCASMATALRGVLRQEQSAPVERDERGSWLNDWFLSLEPGRQAVLREDKWMLANAAFEAGYARAALEKNLC